MNTRQATTSRLSSLALAGMLTLAMLLGVNALATSADSTAPQMAQAASTRA